MLNFCDHPDCNTAIMPGHDLCKEHKAQAMASARKATSGRSTKRSNPKRASKGRKPRNPYLTHDGKVRQGQGLARLRAADRAAWLARQAEEIQKDASEGLTALTE